MPKDLILSKLPSKVYKKLPLKQFSEKTLKYMARNFADEFMILARQDCVNYECLLEFIEHAKHIKDKTKAVAFLVSFTRHPAPAIREAAYTNLTKYDKYLDDIFVDATKDDNEIIRAIGLEYLVTPNVYLDEVKK